MSGESLKKTVVVTNPQGFHMRPVTKFAETAGRYRSKVTVTREGVSVDGKSALELMTNMLSLPGTELIVEVDGPDAREALDALVAVMAAPTEEE
jgi:phosphotransferase system HPr (HPr) family protein